MHVFPCKRPQRPTTCQTGDGIFSSARTAAAPTFSSTRRPIIATWPRKLDGVRRLIGLERSCFAQPDNDSILPGLTTIVIERFVSKINVSSRKPVDRRAEGEKGGGVESSARRWKKNQVVQRDFGRTQRAEVEAEAILSESTRLTQAV